MRNLHLIKVKLTHHLNPWAFQPFLLPIAPAIAFLGILNIFFT
ncbi:MAG TPA: hypothetical protein V6D43_22465 [Candidatus Sericytochromatia bacterium]